MKENKNSQKEKKTDDKKKCFIIMPITIPKSLIPEYSGGEDHFAHVLDQIFIPAIEKSNLDPIPPKVAGSGVIQADIIKNLETADLVLCDMSTLNPNVFFEFGIRTALNKPVSLVVDDKTSKIPFDPSIIHHYEYNSALQSWTYEEDINSLSDHINESIKQSKKENSLWKYFGLSSMAPPLEEKAGVEGKVDYLTVIVESLKEKIEKRHQPINMESEFSGKFIGVEIIEKAKKMELILRNMRINDKEKNIYLEIEGKFDTLRMSSLSKIAEDHDWNLIIGKWEPEGPL